MATAVSRLISQRFPGLKSSLFKKGLKNAGWSMIDYLVMPILMILATPFLIHRLGAGSYGIWMLVNGFVGMLGVMGFGLGEATIKYVSHFRAREDMSSVLRVVRSTLTMYGALGVLTAGVYYLGAPLLVGRVFKVEPELTVIAIQALRLGGVLMAFKLVDSVFLAVLRGFERYDLSARINMPMKVLNISMAVTLAMTGHGIVTILLGTLGQVCVSICIQSWFAGRLISSFNFLPVIDLKMLREVFSFGVWSWFQGIAGSAFSQSDRFLISAFLGTTPLAYYVAFLQVAQQVHAILAAGSQMLFPMTSTLQSRGDSAQMRSLYLVSMRIVCTLATAGAVPLYLMAHWLLTRWMGPEVAARSTDLLQLLILAYGGVAALTTVSYYLLMGASYIRINVLFGTFSGILVALTGALLIPNLGVIGAAWAYVANMTVATAGLMYIERVVFGLRSVKGALLYPCAYMVAVLGVVALDRLGHLTTQPIWILASVSMVMSVLAGGLVYWIVGYLKSAGAESRIVSRTGLLDPPGERVT